MTLAEQIITYGYKQAGTSQGFNALIHKIVSKGIYEGGEISLTSGGAEQCTVAPFVVIIEDEDANCSCRIQTLEDSTEINISQAKPYIVGKFNWSNIDGNTMSITSEADTTDADIIFGKIVYLNNASTTTIDYTHRTTTKIVWENLNDVKPDFWVESEGVGSVEVSSFKVNKGTAVINGKKVEFNGQGNISVINMGVSVLQNKIVLICLKSNGTLAYIESNDDTLGNLVKPTIPNDMLGLAYITLRGSQAIFNGTNIENIYHRTNEIQENPKNTPNCNIEVDDDLTVEPFVEGEYKYLFTSVEKTLTLGSGRFIGQKIEIINLSDDENTVIVNTEDEYTLNGGTTLTLMWTSSQWKKIIGYTMDTQLGTASTKDYGIQEGEIALIGENALDGEGENVPLVNNGGTIEDMATSVTSGNFGLSAQSYGGKTNGTNVNIPIPYITVDSFGRITNITQNNLSLRQYDGGAICSSEASTSTKICTTNLNGTNNFDLYEGLVISVLFEKGNTATNPYLQIDGSTSAPIMAIKNGSRIAPYSNWDALTVLDLMWDGQYWLIVNNPDVHTESSYSVKANGITIETNDKYTVDILYRGIVSFIEDDADDDYVVINMRIESAVSSIPPSMSASIDRMHMSGIKLSIQGDTDNFNLDFTGLACIFPIGENYSITKSSFKYGLWQKNGTFPSVYVLVNEVRNGVTSQRTVSFNDLFYDSYTAIISNIPPTNRLANPYGTWYGKLSKVVYVE